MNCRVPFALLALFASSSACCLAAPADVGEEIPVGWLKWHLPKCASLEGDVLTVVVDAETKGMTTAWADIDLSDCRDGFVAEIEASGEGISQPPNPWLGFKFMMVYYDPAMKIMCYPGANGPHGSFSKRRFRLVDSFPNRTRQRAKLHLGIQSATGKAVFDLSTLKIRKSQPAFKMFNADYKVKYPEAVRGRRLLRGVMSPVDPIEKDFADLREWSATMMRYQMVRHTWGMSEKELLDLEAYRRWLDGRLELLEKVLAWGEKYGIMVVVDLHAAPGAAVGGKGLRMFYDQKCMDEFFATWRRIATQFKGRRWIYGYDLINEPHHDDGVICDYLEVQRRAAEIVRGIDPDTTIIIESNAMCLPVTFGYLSPLAMDNVIYQVHMYNPGGFSHQGVGSKEAAKDRPFYPDPAKGWDRDFLVNELKPVADFARRHDAKIYVGEFSAIAWAPGADKWMEDCISIFEEYGWDWTYHAFREWPGWSVEHEGTDRNHMVPSSDNPRMRVLKRGLRGEVRAGVAAGRKECP